MILLHRILLLGIVLVFVALSDGCAAGGAGTTLFNGSTTFGIGQQP